VLKKQIAASILSANFATLGDDVTAVLTAGADMIHFDVMDNHYVPNLTIGALVCKALRNHGITAPIDVHLMVKPVDQLIVDFAKAGATTITFHPEASEHIDRSLQLIRDNGCSAGLAFNPGSSFDCLPYLADKLDAVLIMSVNPGFAGQAFIPMALNKLREVRQMLDTLGKTDCRLAVDGGVNENNIASIAAAGADTLIAGSAIFHSESYKTTLLNMRTAIESVG